MQKIEEIMCDYLKEKRVTDEEFINFCFLESLNYFNNRDYVKLLKIGNYKENFLSTYFPDEQIILINYQKLIYSLSFDIANDKSLKTYEERLFVLNLMILKALFHEIQHARQKQRVIEKGNEIEGKIIFFSNQCDKFLKQNKIHLYNSKLYYLSPLERSAEIIAFENIMKFCSLHQESAISDYIVQHYSAICNLGYEWEKNKRICPLDTYVSACDNIYASQELKSLNDKASSFNLRKVYGLKLDKDEYTKIQYIKNRRIV